MLKMNWKVFGFSSKSSGGTFAGDPAEKLVQEILVMLSTNIQGSSERLSGILFLLPFVNTASSALFVYHLFVNCQPNRIAKGSEMGQSQLMLRSSCSAGANRP